MITPKWTYKRSKKSRVHKCKMTKGSLTIIKLTGWDTWIAEFTPAGKKALIVNGTIPDTDFERNPDKFKQQCISWYNDRYPMKGVL